MKKFFVASLAALVMTATVACHRHAQANVPTGWSDGAVIEYVQVSGNHQIDITTISAVMQTKAGAKIDSELIRADIGRLRALGFEYIRVKEEKGEKGGKILTFNMREKLPKT